MTLMDAKEGEEYIVKEIVTEDDDLDSISFFPGMLQRRADYRGFPCPRRLHGFHQRREI